MLKDRVNLLSYPLSISSPKVKNIQVFFGSQTISNIEKQIINQKVVGDNI
jgi:hypothetical protein